MQRVKLKLDIPRLIGSLSAISFRQFTLPQTSTLTRTKMSKRNVERKLKHLFDGSDWNVYESKILNLGVGAPGTDLLQSCCDIFQKATIHRLQHERDSNSSLLFQYGPTSGTFDARCAIAKYFSAAYGSNVRSEDLFITSGATQGLHIILSTLVDLNGYIFVDEVTYMIALDVIKQFSTLTIIPVRLNDDGVDVKHLEQALKERRFHSKSKEFWGMYYTIPTYHNPTGILFSENVCKGLVKLAREYDLLIACDDVYNVLHYKDAQAPKRLFAYDEESAEDYRGNVISNGSFSKIIGPGLRLGWLELPSRIKPLLENSGISGSGGCLNNYTSGIVASLFELSLGQQQIRTTYSSYRERMLATCMVLEQQLPSNCSMISPRGGYFIWIRLPQNVDAKDFLKSCMEEENIYFILGSRFSFEKSARNCLRISIAFHSTEKLVDGATRLCAALRRFLKV